MQDIVLEPKKTHFFKAFGASLLFVLVAVFLFIIAGNPSRPEFIQITDKIVAVIIGGFGGFGSIIILYKFFTTREKLIVNEVGIIYYGTLIPWDSIEEFTVCPINTVDFLLMQLKNYDEIAATLPQNNKSLNKLNKLLIGEAFIIDSKYWGFKPEDLKNILKKYLKTYRTWT